MSLKGKLLTSVIQSPGARRNWNRLASYLQERGPDCKATPSFIRSPKIGALSEIWRGYMARVLPRPILPYHDSAAHPYRKLSNYSSPPPFPKLDKYSLPPPSCWSVNSCFRMISCLVLSNGNKLAAHRFLTVKKEKNDMQTVKLCSLEQQAIS